MDEELGTMISLNLGMKTLTFRTQILKLFQILDPNLKALINVESYCRNFCISCFRVDFRLASACGLVSWPDFVIMSNLNGFVIARDFSFLKSRICL